jgi:hypothetical protein
MSESITECQRMFSNHYTVYVARPMGVQHRGWKIVHMIGAEKKTAFQSTENYNVQYTIKYDTFRIEPRSSATSSLERIGENSVRQRPPQKT